MSVEGVGKEVFKLLNNALKDEFWYIRSIALNALGKADEKNRALLVEQVKRMARQDKRGAVRSDAILTLSEWGGEKYKDIYQAALNDSSYMAAAAAIVAYAGTNAPDVPAKVAKFENEKSEDVVLAVSSYYAVKGGPEKNDWFVKKVKEGKGSGLYYLLQNFASYLAANSTANTPENIALLADMARNHNQYYIRLGAMQALFIMSEKAEVQALIKEIKENEKDKRLIEMYKQI